MRFLNNKYACNRSKFIHFSHWNKRKMVAYKYCLKFLLKILSILSNNRFLKTRTTLANNGLVLQVYDCRLNSVNFKYFDFQSVVCLCKKLHTPADLSIYIRKAEIIYSKHRNISFYSECFSSVWTVKSFVVANKKFNINRQKNK